MSSTEIVDLEARLSALEDALVGATAEHFTCLESEHDDPLAAIEIGVNIVVENLRMEIESARELNRRLDEKVNERTRELQTKLTEITAQHELIQRQQQAIHELSTPVLRLWDQVIALPIIGVIDTRRSAMLMQALLDTIAAGNVRYAILDVTGVEILDTRTAAHLLQIIRSAQLLGAKCILTGVRPAVAQTLVGIADDFAGLLIRRNLQDGLETCLQAMRPASERGVVR